MGYSQIVQLAQSVAQERAQVALPPLAPSPFAALPPETAAEVELQVKYENYVRKQEQLISRTKRLEEMRIPDTLDYREVQHLRIEARQKLMRTLPRTVGQASRVEGVSPADIAILMIYLEKLRALKLSS